MQVRPSLHFTSLRFTSPHCSSLHLTALHFTAQTCTDDMHLISPARRAIDHLRTRFSTLSHSTNLHLSAQEHNAMSSSAPSPMREAPPSPSATTNRSPACQSAPPEPPQAANTSPTHLRRLSDYIALTKQNTTSVLALTCLTILIAALIEDPPAHLLSGYALIAALVGVLCAGSGIWAVLKWEEGAEAGVLRWSPDLEDVWGRVWRWVTDQWGKGVDEGESTVLSSARAKDRAAGGALEGEGTTADSSHKDVSTAPGTPSPQPRSLPEQSLHHSLTHNTAFDLDHADHASGLLGPSPMPPRFRHFTGAGFHKHAQELRAAGRSSAHGQNFGEVLRVIKESESRD